MGLDGFADFCPAIEGGGLLDGGSANPELPYLPADIA
jgi:hypothetical protein